MTEHKHPREIAITGFNLDEFEHELHADDIELLRRDEYARNKLTGMFLDALGWVEAMEVACDVWREWAAEYKAAQP